MYYPLAIANTCFSPVEFSPCICVALLCLRIHFDLFGSVLWKSASHFSLSQGGCWNSELQIDPHTFDWQCVPILLRPQTPPFVSLKRRWWMPIIQIYIEIYTVYLEILPKPPLFRKFLRRPRSRERTRSELGPWTFIPDVQASWDSADDWIAFLWHGHGLLSDTYTGTLHSLARIFSCCR